MSDVEPTSIRDYREELVLTLSTARETALESIRKAQRRYNEGYDRRADNYSYCVGDWVLIRFPSEETGRLRKLSRPWRGPYRVTSCNETNVTAVKVYFPREDPIQVHQLRVKPCPRGFTAGYYWYGSKRRDLVVRHAGYGMSWLAKIPLTPSRNRVRLFATRPLLHLRSLQAMLLSEQHSNSLDCSWRSQMMLSPAVTT